MRVLVAFEESQAVTKEMRRLGHEAYSCDIIECSGGHPEWHIRWDALEIINGNCSFMTCDGSLHRIDGRWDLLIAHPPCTYLTSAGACNIPKHPERIALGFEAAKVFEKVLSADCEKIAAENPPPMKRFCLPQYSQLVRPYMFGNTNNKPICFWLKNLPKLKPTDVVPKDEERVVWYHKKTGAKKSCSKWYNTNTNQHRKHRSVTFPGVARAMAEQWAGPCEEESK